MNETIGAALIAGMNKIEDTLISIAPKAWEIYLKQQYVDAVGFFLTAMVCFIGIYYFHKLFKYGLAGNGDEQALCQVFGIMGCVVSTIAGTSFLYNAIGRIINPEYYVIQALANLI